MTDEIRDRIIDLFWESITDMSWEDWCFTSAGDKENIAVDTVLTLIEDVASSEVTNLFWDWANGLEESDFED